MTYVHVHDEKFKEKLDLGDDVISFDVVFETGHVRFYVRSSDITVHLCRIELKQVIKEFENNSISNIPKDFFGIFLDLNKFCHEDNEISLTNFSSLDNCSMADSKNYKGFFWQNRIDKYSSLMLKLDDVKISDIIKTYPYPMFTTNGKSIVDIMIPHVNIMLEQKEKDTSCNNDIHKLIEYAHNLLYVKIPNYREKLLKFFGMLCRNIDNDIYFPEIYNDTMIREYNDIKYLADKKYDNTRETCFTFLEYLSHVFSDDFRKMVKETFFDAVMSRLICDYDDISKEYIKRAFKNKIVTSEDIYKYFVDIKENIYDFNNFNNFNDFSTRQCQMCMDETNGNFKECKHPICHECLVALLFEKKANTTANINNDSSTSEKKIQLCHECNYLEKNKNNYDDYVFMRVNNDIGVNIYRNYGFMEIGARAMGLPNRFNRRPNFL
jgi:hypothetical protein